MNNLESLFPVINVVCLDSLLLLFVYLDDDYDLCAVMWSDLILYIYCDVVRLSHCHHQIYKE